MQGRTHLQGGVLPGEPDVIGPEGDKVLHLVIGPGIWQPHGQRGLELVKVAPPPPPHPKHICPRRLQCPTPPPVTAGGSSKQPISPQCCPIALCDTAQNRQGSIAPPGRWYTVKFLDQTAISYAISTQNLSGTQIPHSTSRYYHRHSAQSHTHTPHSCIGERH